MFGRCTNVRAIWSSPLIFSHSIKCSSIRKSANSLNQTVSVTFTQRRHKSCGIVGLPNVGKSALFNALTQTQLAQSSNYPFTTIDPNTASVAVVDQRLIKLSKLANSQKCIFTQLNFVDIAGLIAGASKGAGLGSKFLSNIREVSVILHLLRCFEDSEIIHVNSKIDPISDMETIEAELLLADIDTLDKRIENSKKKSKSGQSDADATRMKLVEQCLTALNAGIPIIDVVFSADDQAIVDTFQLLTSKPVAFVCNVDEASAATGNDFSKAVVAYVEKLNASAGVASVKDGIKIKPYPRTALIVSAQLESDAVASFDTEESRREFLAMSDLSSTSLDRVIESSSRMLKQQVYYTVGPQEARAWTIPVGCLAPSAAGKIHSDIENGFVNAEIISAADFIEHGGEDGARAAGKVRVEGKNYVMQDGDIANFRFNKTKGAK